MADSDPMECGIAAAPPSTSIRRRPCIALGGDCWCPAKPAAASLIPRTDEDGRSDSGPTGSAVMSHSVRLRKAGPERKQKRSSAMCWLMWSGASGSWKRRRPSRDRLPSRPSMNSRPSGLRASRPSFASGPESITSGGFPITCCRTSPSIGCRRSRLRKWIATGARRCARARRSRRRGRGNLRFPRRTASG